MSRPPLLLSYHYYRTRDIRTDLQQIYGDNTPPIFLDSGAYSAFTTGVEIDLDDYVKYIHEFGDVITNYSNLDVIGDWRKGNENLTEMEYQGLSPLPVYHQSDPWELLEPMADRYNYVALGGMVGKPRTLLRKYLLRCFALFRRMGYPCKVHGFGITSWEFVRGFPWTSVDSSTWTQGLRWGLLRLFHNGQFNKMVFKDIKSVYDAVDLLMLYGVTPNDLIIRSRFDRPRAARLGAYSWMRAEDWINEQRGQPSYTSSTLGPNSNLILPNIFSTYNTGEKEKEGIGTERDRLTIYLATWLFDKAQENGLRSMQRHPPERIEREFNGKYDRPGYDPDTDPNRRGGNVGLGHAGGRAGQSSGTRRKRDNGVDQEDRVHNASDSERAGGRDGTDNWRSREKERAVRATKRRIHTAERSSTSVGREVQRRRGERVASSSE